MIRILVIEDNRDLAFGLQTALEVEGYEVRVAEDGPGGLREAGEYEPDLVVLDLMLPGMDGYRVLRALRESGFDAPVLILTARAEETDKVLGFDTGADDYVTKPFGVLELLARVRALLRRTGVALEDEPDRPIEQFGDVVVDVAARTVLRAGEPVELSPKEFDLLVALLRRDGAVASRHELLKEVWGYQAVVPTRTVDMHISELRRKLEGDSSRPRHILTVRKAGYRLER
ncbi:MAG: response regulator transcription factor [Gemmatimonadetes bacterium]|uniref:Phosphate regulon transcriptional regulatory protein PhoB n=1 Tax=Candidatus Kutchimonas denitrificans TaxID=3056748 RepID=A0AAE4Z713_9BACT|nr:response regulator transcription factor [Gemmatimonadota bacterium]NIR73642.1 response regulator transcription factor [Candidatus Kutchimonas denitrificans]NIR99601.1 response regulator transcription factor [Gemmatimonadota bacterium]NIT65221.1 response regulator transcription factor [Gemmatimonadota bacterium]NIV23754.1 response regulator [Gemmatimonadota bacterium]